MPRTETVTLWVMVDDGGDFAVGRDEETATQAYADEINNDGPRHLVKLTVALPIPEPIELNATVAAVEPA